VLSCRHYTFNFKLSVTCW